MVMVIRFVAPVTTVPDASSTLTVMDGVIALPATTLVGWTVKASLVGVPPVTLKAVLVVPVSPVALAANV
jgi:hypothetical protein